MVLHGIEPVYDGHSRILILGSFPSVRSRATGFFYGHPQNRFWRVLAAVAGCAAPETIPEKKAFLLSHGIALWDVTAACEIAGSSDSSIRSAVPNDITAILRSCDIDMLCTNGRTAQKLYDRLTFPETGRAAICLPSTSPANAAFNIDKLITAWSVIRRHMI